MIKPLFSRPFLSPMMQSSELGLFALIAGGVMVLTTAFFLFSLILSAYFHVLDKKPATRRFFSAAVLFELYLFLMTLRFLFVVLLPVAPCYNNLVLYSSLVLMAMATLQFWRAVQTLESDRHLPLYTHSLGDIAVYLGIIGALGYIMSGVSVFMRLTELGFSIILLHGLFLVRRRLVSPTLKAMGIVGALMILFIALVYWGRDVLRIALPFAPELTVTIAATLSGFFAGVHLLGLFRVHQAAHTAQGAPFLQRTHVLSDIHLSRRESEILAMVLAGKDGPQISQTLGCSEKTVRNHISHIYEKSNTRNRVELVLLFGREND